LPESRAAVVLATRSAGKLAELTPLVVAAGLEAVTLGALGIAEDPAEEEVEAFATFEENARAKARWFARRVGRRDVAVVAEDSGLEVAALGGTPGVRSKRWTGSALRGSALDAANNAALVRALSGEADRRARYVCVAVCVHGDAEWSARGETAGRILEAPRGSGGFGYDPYFLSDDLGVTFAEATREEKARVSHRGRAVRALLAVCGGGRAASAR
jgi:XTP/dITP diphosphohydrolase